MMIQQFFAHSNNYINTTLLDSKNPAPTRFRKTAKGKKSKKTKKLSSGNKNHRADWQSHHTNTVRNYLYILKIHNIAGT